MTTCVYQDGVLYTDTKQTALPISDEQKQLIAEIRANPKHPLHWHAMICKSWRLATEDGYAVNLEKGKFMDVELTPFQIHGEQVLAACFTGLISAVPFLEHYISNGLGIIESLEKAQDRVCEVYGEETRFDCVVQVLAVTKSSVYLYTPHTLHAYREYRFNRNRTIVIGSGGTVATDDTLQSPLPPDPTPMDLIERYHTRSHLGNVVEFYNLVASVDLLTNNDVQMRRC